MSNLTYFLKELLKEHPELRAFYDTEQYKLSGEIIKYMVNGYLTEEQVSELLGVDLSYFYRLASGDNTIEISEYEKVISKLQEIAIL